MSTAVEMTIEITHGSHSQQDYNPQILFKLIKLGCAFIIYCQISLFYPLKRLSQMPLS